MPRSDFAIGGKLSGIHFAAGRRKFASGKKLLERALRANAATTKYFPFARRARSNSARVRTSPYYDYGGYLHRRDYPPAIAPTIRNGSLPEVIASGSGASTGS